jgi:DNA replication and repair protein RecF
LDSDLSSKTNVTEAPRIRDVVIEKLRVQGVRNLEPCEVSFSRGLNVFLGDNGQGKTSFLEALTLGTTSRSFRTEQSRDIISYQRNDAVVEIEIVESGLRRKQRVVLANGRKATFVDEKRIAKISDFALRTPVVVFHPTDLTLVGGPSSLRRTLLDRVALYLLPISLESRKFYLQALRERQKVLSERGVRASELEAYEQVACEHGVTVARAHAVAAARLIEAFSPIAERLSSKTVTLSVRYVPGGSTDESRFRQKLIESRTVDLVRGRPTFGPQRDDLTLYLGDSEARKQASQGQQRLLALALKLSELSAIRQCRQQHPVLLLDDVVSELDPFRTQAVMDWVSRLRSQVFVTTTRVSSRKEGQFPDLPRRDFWLRDGAIEPDKLDSETVR